MIIGFEENQISNWKSDLIQYQQKRKRKNPFQLEQQTSVDPPRRRIELLREERQLHQTKSSVFQSRNNQIKAYRPPPNKYKHEKNYDILTHESLYEPSSKQNMVKNKQLGPIRNIYNPVNGQMMPPEYMKGRAVMLPKFYQQKQYHFNKRDFNIVSLEYKEDHENRIKIEEEKAKIELLNKYKKQCDYDKIYCRFYSPQKQQNYWETKKVQDFEKSKQNFEKRLPPSYQIRDKYIQDLTQPLPEGLIQFDRKQQNAKKGRLQKLLYQKKCQQANERNNEKEQLRIMHKAKTLEQVNLKKNQIFPSVRQQKTIQSAKPFKNSGF